MMRFRPRPNANDAPAVPHCLIGASSSFRGTLMVSGTLRIDGEFEGDVLNCDRLEIGEHGIMRADVEVKEALVMGRVIGNMRALGTIEMKAGARVEGDVAAISVVMEPGVFFSGRCTMLESGASGVELGQERYQPQRG